MGSVLVLGAGVAGLVAARDLEAAGERVAVLEATERVGGRVRTIRDFADGSHAEAGAELLEAGHAQLWRLVRSLGLRRVRVLRRGFAFWGEDDRVRPMSWDRLVGRLARVGAELDRDGRSWAGPNARRWARVSVESWLRRSRFRETERERWRALVRGLYLGDPRRFSMLQLADELTGGAEEGPEGGFFRIRGGNDLLPRALEAELAGPVRRGVVVRRVVRSGAGVRVVAEVRGRVDTLAADAAVVALPPPPLRDVEFRPALPTDVARALRTIGFGRVTKTVLRLRARPRGAKGGAWGSALPVGAFWDAGEHVPGRPALLSLTAGGDLSARAGAGSEEERVARAARGQPLVPVEDVVEGRSTAWDREPFARGGYAVFDVGFDPALREALSRPVPPLVFAGEHTSREHQGYVEGAVESGRRAAKDVLRMKDPRLRGT